MLDRDALATAQLPPLPPPGGLGTARLPAPARALTDRLDSLAHLWSWNLRRIEAPQAWEITRGDPRVVVAVVDTGIDPGHPDLNGKVLPGMDVVRDLRGATDDQGHGTAVAGIIASRGWRGRGLAGVAPACRVLPVKCNRPGTGDVTAEHIAAGVRAAIAAGARILNLSVGVVLGEEGLTADGLEQMRAAILEALEQGAVVVCAAGPGRGQSPYPALWAKDVACKGLIAVGATTRQDALSPHSPSGDFVTVYAPADGILSTARGGGYAPFGATSAASPHVAGIAALIRSVQPDASPAEVRALAEAGANGGLASAWGSLKRAVGNLSRSALQITDN